METSYPHLKRFQHDFFSRLLLPSLHHSQHEHRKWLTLFLAKHSPVLSVDAIPQVPITPRIWRILVSDYGQLLPASVINDYSKFVLFQWRQPRQLTRLNTALLNDSTLRNDDAVKR